MNVVVSVRGGEGVRGRRVVVLSAVAATAACRP